MYKAFPYEKTSVRTKLYKCFYVFISYRERISFISDAAPRRLTSKCACGRVLFKSQLLTLGYFCFGYRPVGSYIFFGNRSHVGASFISLAPTFFQKSERAHAAAPPFQITTAYAGLRFGFGCKPENCGIYTVAIFQLIVRSFCCSSLPNRTRCAGLRFGFGYESENFVMYSAWIFRVAAKFALLPRLFYHRHKPALFHPPPFKIDSILLPAFG